MCYNISTKRVATTAKESTSMKYVVEVIYGNRNEWSDEIEFYGDALNHALAMSELQGVSETRVWADDEIVAICVDGIFQVDECEDWGDEEEDEWAEYDEPNYPFDEWGYDPYTGGFDPDL
jgi:hypothetical protein